MSVSHTVPPGAAYMVTMMEGRDIRKPIPLEDTAIFV